MKILYVLSYLSRNGGVQSVVNNYFEFLDRNIEVDFLVLLPGDNDFESEIEKKGSHVYHLKGSQEKNILLFLKEIKRFFKAHHDYDVIHSHQTNLDIFYLREAKKWKIPVRILHAHNTSYDISKFRMTVLRLMSKTYANYYFACSKEAGQFMFGKKIINNSKFFIINNAINVEKYTYNEEIRKKLRKELKLEDTFIIGNIARMTEIKNHKFLIEIFKEITNLKKNARLLLIGDGPLKSSLEEKVKKFKLEDKVIFYGITKKANELLQIMDVFVLPSLFEGVPVTIIEAAASGVKFVISDKIDSHLKTSDLELRLSLNLTAKQWANMIIQFSKNYLRKDEKELLKNSGFDIQHEVRRLEEIYKNALEGESNNA